MMQLDHALSEAVETIRGWQNEFGAFAAHPSLAVDDGVFDAAYTELLAGLRDNYPFFHPRYLGQMLKPLHSAAFAAMLINPNNRVPAAPDMPAAPGVPAVGEGI